ncbi:MAG: DUF2996 domain-containing protein [Oscillatoriales cyanobacterium RM2_1_1]|nr:DUF2996 domain-containing protein [Oscillatoriales cyanobacterium SM2_3_0]NJO47381.1 DUF2996 domain-containing protein [Oscillatoriales cyanobacterium RM2_1_1]
MSEETKPNSAAASEEAQPKAAPKSAGKKPPKPPAVEDKPFNEFVEQEYLPALEKALNSQGVEDLELKFIKQKFPPSVGVSEECWQVIGQWQSGKRQFSLYFPGEDIKSQKFFSCVANSAQTSTVEQFLGDERKITLDLMVFGIIQRLNAQKWLTQN